MKELDLPVKTLHVKTKDWLLLKYCKLNHCHKVINIYNIYWFIFYHLGTKPSILQYWEGESASEICSFPPSSTESSLILKNCPGAWTDLIFQTPAPATTGSHCWLEFPVLSHWTTLDPLVFFYSAMSSDCPFKTLCNK